MNESDRIIDRTKNSYTEQLHFLYGSYISNGSTVPYIVSVLTYEEVSKYLTLFEEMHKSGHKWEIRDLIQRQIDWKRVDNDIIDYLESDRPVFFNGITVVLMPKGKNELTVSFNNENILPNSNVLEVGPIKFKFYSQEVPKPNDDAFLSGQVSWDTKKVLAVAIDGQHRVAAIKELIKGNLNAQAELDNKVDSRVPVMFLLFDEKMGYNTVGDYRGIDIVRRIFLDLNSHAVHVPRTRQILLDDVQVRSLFVKNVIAKKMYNDLSTLEGSDKRIPLSLIDWHTDNNKLDTNPYLTTITLLDSLINILTNLKPNDYSDYEATLDCIKKISANEINLSDIYSRYEDAEEKNIQFDFTDIERDKFVEVCKNEVKPIVIGILTMFKPYQDFCAKRLGLGTLSYEWQTWYPIYDESLKPDASKAKEQLKTYEKDLVDSNYVNFSPTKFVNNVTSCINFKGQSTHLPFKTVFQKTLFKSFTQFSPKVNPSIEGKISDFISENIDSSSKNDAKIIRSTMFDETLMKLVDFESLDDLSVSYRERMKKICLYVYLANTIYSKCYDVFNYNYSFTIKDNYDNNNERNVFYWQGSFYNKDSNTIDHSKSAVDRSADLLTLMIMFSYIKIIDRNIDFDELWRSILDPSVSVELFRDCFILIKRLSKMETKSPSLVGRIFKNLDIEVSTQNEQRALDEIKIRIEHLWKIL